MKFDWLFGANKRMMWLSLCLVAAAVLRLSDGMSTGQSPMTTVQASAPNGRVARDEPAQLLTDVSLDQVFRQGMQAEVGKDPFAALQAPPVGAAASVPARSAQPRPLRVANRAPAPVTPAVPPPVTAPPAPVSPAFPFTVLGRFEMEGSSWLLLSAGNQVRSVKIGQNFDGGWKLEHLSANQATVVHLASGEKRVLALSSGK